VLQFLESDLQLPKDLKDEDIGDWNVNHSTSLQLYRIHFIPNALSALGTVLYAINTCFIWKYHAGQYAISCCKLRFGALRSSPVNFVLCNVDQPLHWFNPCITPVLYFHIPKWVAWAFINRMIWQESTWVQIFIRTLTRMVKMQVLLQRYHTVPKFEHIKRWTSNSPLQNQKRSRTRICSRPILYNTYPADFPESSAKRCMYADDVALTVSLPTFGEADLTISLLLTLTLPGGDSGFQLRKLCAPSSTWRTTHPRRATRGGKFPPEIFKTLHRNFDIYRNFRRIKMKFYILINFKKSYWNFSLSCSLIISLQDLSWDRLSDRKFRKLLVFNHKYAGSVNLGDCLDCSYF